MEDLEKFRGLVESIRRHIAMEKLREYLKLHGRQQKSHPKDTFTAQLKAYYTESHVRLTCSNGLLDIHVLRRDLDFRTEAETSYILIIDGGWLLLKAFPVNFEIGQLFYDISSNRCSRIIQIPQRPSLKSEESIETQKIPRYIVENSSGDSIELLETDLEDHLVGPKHETASLIRIKKWLNSLRLHWMIDGRVPSAYVLQLSRDASKHEKLHNYLKQNPKNWDVNDKHPMTNQTALSEAVKYHNNEIIRLLVNFGANPNERVGKEELFILYYNLKDTSPGAIETTRLLLSLPETKADPDDVLGSSNAIASSAGKQYWLEVSRNRKPYERSDMEKIGTPRLSEFAFALYGQQYAQWKLAKDIATTLANQQSYNRLVFLLGGPPGHGKTMAASKLAAVLGDDAAKSDFLKISCANLNSVYELFGGGGAYKGSEVGSELNNFVVNHSNRIGIVNLDEFDRLDSKVQDGFFTIFDKGEWVDKKSSSRYQSKTLDCRKIVWILTTNVLDEKIVSFHKRQITNFSERNWRHLEKRFKKEFRGEIETVFGDAMARRIGSLIPFVPFSEMDPRWYFGTKNWTKVPIVLPWNLLDTQSHLFCETRSENHEPVSLLHNDDVLVGNPVLRNCQ